jgi:hypothetical protein
LENFVYQKFHNKTPTSKNPSKPQLTTIYFTKEKKRPTKKETQKSITTIPQTLFGNTHTRFQRQTPQTKKSITCERQARPIFASETTRFARSCMGCGKKDCESLCASNSNGERYLL